MSTRALGRMGVLLAVIAMAAALIAPAAGAHGPGRSGDPDIPANERAHERANENAAFNRHSTPPPTTAPPTTPPTSPPTTDAPPTTTPPTTVPPTDGVDWCDPTDTAINDGHHSGTEFDQAYTDPKGPLSDEDCAAVTADLDAAAEFVSEFATLADALDAGWELASAYEDGQGHHVVWPERLTGPIDLERPNYLLYDGDESTSNLVGVMYLGIGFPTADFAGDNDHWHNHVDPLCMELGGFYVFADDLTDAECAALGGRNTNTSAAWMLHAWIVPGWEHPSDVFDRSHPDLFLDGGGHGHGHEHG